MAAISLDGLCIGDGSTATLLDILPVLCTYSGVHSLPLKSIAALRATCRAARVSIDLHNTKFKLAANCVFVPQIASLLPNATNVTFVWPEALEYLDNITKFCTLNMPDLTFLRLRRSRAAARQARADFPLWQEPLNHFFEADLPNLQTLDISHGSLHWMLPPFHSAAPRKFLPNLENLSLDIGSISPTCLRFLAQEFIASNKLTSLSLRVTGQNKGFNIINALLSTLSESSNPPPPLKVLDLSMSPVGGHQSFRSNLMKLPNLELCRVLNWGSDLCLYGTFKPTGAALELDPRAAGVGECLGMAAKDFDLSAWYPYYSGDEGEMEDEYYDGEEEEEEEEERNVVVAGAGAQEVAAVRLRPSTA